MKRETNKTANLNSIIKSILYFIALVLFLLLVSKVRAGSSCEFNTTDPAYCLRSIELIKSNLAEGDNELLYLEGLELKSTPLIQQFYHQNGYKPAWTKGNEPTLQAKEMMNLFMNSYIYGIEPALFYITELEYYLEDMAQEDELDKSIRARARFEFLLTNSAFTFMLYLSKGNQYSNPRDVFLKGDPVLSSLPCYLAGIISSNDIKSKILAVQPQTQQYTDLQHEMEILVSFLTMLEQSGKEKDLSIAGNGYNDLFNYLLKDEALTTTETSDPDEASTVEQLMRIQKLLEVRENGKMNYATRAAISIRISSRYAELAYEIETLRSQSMTLASLQ